MNTNIKKCDTTGGLCELGKQANFRLNEFSEIVKSKYPNFSSLNSKEQNDIFHIEFKKFKESNSCGVDCVIKLGFETEQIVNGLLKKEA